MKKDRIPEQVLPGNYYDGEVLYGSEMNKIVNILRTGVNANKTDIDNIILDVEKYASITNLGIIDPSELDDISQEGIYKYSVQRPDGGVDNYLLFHISNVNAESQIRYIGNWIYVRSRIINRSWFDWVGINLLDINSNIVKINNLNNTLNSVENKVNENTDDISDLNSSLNNIKGLLTSIVLELNRKVDKELSPEQSVNSKVNFRGGIKTDFIYSNGLVIENDTVFGINADKKVAAGEYYEGIVHSDDTRLATRKYVADKFAELVGSSPEALDTIYELAEALQNNPDIINELLTEQYNLQNNKVDKTTKINGKALVSDINLTKADIGLSNVDNTSDLDKPISRAVQAELDKKANNADLAPILNLENTGFFERYGNFVETTTFDFIRYLEVRVFSELDFKTPIRIGIRHSYGLDKYLILTDSPIQDFEGIVEYYDTIYADYAVRTNAKITIWERQDKAVERQNVKQYVKFVRNSFTTDWESIAYESDIEKVEQELLNEISEVDAKSTKNKNTIDSIISGRQTVGKALTAVNLTSQERHPIEDVFSTRITAKYENEIISSFDEETTAVIDEIGGFSVKQLVRNNNFETNSDWEAGGNATNLVIADNEASYTGSMIGWSAVWQEYELPIKNGDKYYVSAEIMPSLDIASGVSNNRIGFRYTNAGLNGSLIEAVNRWSAKANVWNKISGIITISSYQQGVEPVYFILGTQTLETAGIIKWRKPMLINLTELGLDHLTVEQVEYLLENRYYPYGITNAKPKTFKSIGENLWDYKYFYDTLKAVNADNISYVEKDGRECIKINNPVYYKGIELYKGKFAPNVRYRLIAEGFNETNQNLYMRFVYTDSTYSSAFQIPTDNTEKWHVSDYTSLEGKTIDYITIYLNYNYPTYININKLQLQMLDNPETEFIPYTEKKVELPTAYADYGMPSLPNGVRDRIFMIGNSPDNSKWYYEKNVEKVILNGSEDFVTQRTYDETVLFYYAIDNIKRSTYPQQLHVMNDFFTNVKYEDIYNNRQEGVASRSDQNGLVVGIKKSRIPDWDDKWTSTQKVNAFKQWLQANPITVYYQLNEPQLIRIDDWNSQYLAYNYGREEIVDSEGNLTPTHTVIKYYPDYIKQTQTSSEIMSIQQTTIQSLQSQLESIEARLKALENEKDS